MGRLLDLFLKLNLFSKAAVCEQFILCSYSCLLQLGTEAVQTGETATVQYKHHPPDASKWIKCTS